MSSTLAVLHLPIGGWAANPDRACVGLGTENWFPEVGAKGHESTAMAKKVCAGCVVREQCLEYALGTGVQGIWGGTSENQRTRMREKRRGAG